MNAQNIVKQYGLDKDAWTYKGFHAILHTFFPVAHNGFATTKKHWGAGCTKIVFFVKDRYVHWYWNNADMKKLRETVIANVRNDKNFLKQLRKKWLGLLKKFDEVMKRIDKTNLKKMSDKGLIELYDEFYAKYLDEFGVVMASMDAFSMFTDQFFEPELKEFLRMKGKEAKFTEYYSVLTVPVEDSFLAQEEKDLLKILKAKKQGKNIQKLLNEHQQKYFWIQNNYAVQKKLSNGFFEERLKEFEKKKIDPGDELKKYKERIETAKKEKEKLMKGLELPEEIINYVRITELFACIQDERKKYVMISNWYQRLFFEEVGRRLNIPVGEMEYTVYPELREMLLDKKIDREVLKKRQEGCMQIRTGEHEYEIIAGKRAQEIYETVFAKKETTNEIKGMCASPGKAVGTVKIIKKTHDMANMKQGDVLVASMTRPEMVPALKKAAAIVTDEGGITSHAAIVSREMGIPCIIGTKNATQVLKDGNRVEVDATKGVVRILH